MWHTEHSPPDGAWFITNSSWDGASAVEFRWWAETVTRYRPPVWRLCVSMAACCKVIGVVKAAAASAAPARSLCGRNRTGTSGSPPMYFKSHWRSTGVDAPVAACTPASRNTLPPLLAMKVDGSRGARPATMSIPTCGGFCTVACTTTEAVAEGVQSLKYPLRSMA